MIGDSSSPNVYLAPGVTDMCKFIDGLSLIVSELLELDPFSESGSGSNLLYCMNINAKFNFINQQANDNIVHFF